jgi:hypothetical protein
MSQIFQLIVVKEQNRLQRGSSVDYWGRGAGCSGRAYVIGVAEATLARPRSIYIIHLKITLSHRCDAFPPFVHDTWAYDTLSGV